MKTLETDAEISPDGSLRLFSPLPDWLKTPGRRHLLLVMAEADDARAKPERAKAGLWKGKPGTFWMASDFDAPLEDFREYME